MAHFINSNFILVAIMSMVIAVVLALVVRKVIGLPYLRSHHEVSDPLLACVGTLFAILLGFMVANAMTRFEEARVNVEREAGSISDIYRLSRGLPESTGNAIRSDCLIYVNGVIDVEWKQMAQRKMSYEVWKSYGQIWNDVLAYEPESNRQTNIHSSMLDCMVALGDCRRVRATQMSYAVPDILWVVVLIGAVATGTLVLFFGIENIVLGSCTTALVTLVLYLNVFLLASYDDPFSGEVSVKPHAFEVARESLGRRYKDLRDGPIQQGEADPEESLDDDATDSDDKTDDKTDGKTDGKADSKPVSESSKDTEVVPTF